MIGRSSKVKVKILIKLIINVNQKAVPIANVGQDGGQSGSRACIPNPTPNSNKIHSLSPISGKMWKNNKNCSP